MVLGANLLGVAGLIGISVSVGALTDSWWWSVLLASIFAVVVSVVAGLDAQAQDEQPQHVEPPAPPVGGAGVTSAA